MGAMVAGDLSVERDGDVDGMVGGDARVAPGVTCTLSGMIAGDLVVEDGAAVTLRAMVGGAVILKGGRVTRDG